jgi:hypothetical protein
LFYSGSAKAKYSAAVSPANLALEVGALVDEFLVGLIPVRFEAGADLVLLLRSFDRI